MPAYVPSASVSPPTLVRDCPLLFLPSPSPSTRCPCHQNRPTGILYHPPDNALAAHSLQPPPILQPPEAFPLDPTDTNPLAQLETLKPKLKPEWSSPEKMWYPREEEEEVVREEGARSA